MNSVQDVGQKIKDLTKTVKLFAAAELSNPVEGVIDVASNAASLSSLFDTFKKINQMLTSLNTLATNNTIGNTLTSLKIAKDRLEQLKNTNETDVILWLNQTTSTIFSSVSKVQSSSSSQGVNMTNCTQNIPEGMLQLTLDATVNLTNCPINEANKGLQMINDAIGLVNELANLTTSLPIAVDSCTKQVTGKLKCNVDLVAKYGTTVIGAPVKVSAMATAATLFVNLFPTNIGICASGVAFGAVAATSTWAFDVISCMAGQMAV